MCFKGNFTHMSLIYLPLTHQNVISSYYLMCKKLLAFPPSLSSCKDCVSFGNTKKFRFCLGNRLMKAPLCVSKTFSWEISLVFWRFFLCLNYPSSSLFLSFVPNYIALCLNITMLLFLCPLLEFSENGFPCNCLGNLLAEFFFFFFYYNLISV